jgi:hypothetical protein
MKISFRGHEPCLLDVVEGLRYKYGTDLQIDVSFFPGAGVMHAPTCSKELTRIQKLQQRVDELEKELSKERMHSESSSMFGD